MTKIRVDSENQEKILIALRAIVQIVQEPDMLRDCCDSLLDVLGEMCTAYTELEKERDQARNARDLVIRARNALRKKLLEDTRDLEEGSW